MASSSSKLERTLSIDEPKTLSEAELAAYREAALKVINTHSYEEATRIFMGGKETVVAPEAQKLEPTARADK